jgi:acyl-CoA synthetase (AMP-forming)/AMP-acid ligase II/acyl carrier protein
MSKCTYPDSILGRMDQHALDFPNKLAYTFLLDREEPDSLTFRQLADRVHTLASQFREYAKPGDRAVLIYPNGLEFIPAFLGCLAAGIIAVLAYPPRRNRKDERLHGILADCSPTLVLTSSEVRGTLAFDSFEAELPTVVKTDEMASRIDVNRSVYPPGDDEIAFLQYTSGSTGTPKGVMITHGNLIANERQIQAAFGHFSYAHSEPSVFVNWLPLFHDMGLIGNALHPLYVGFHSILMSPTNFLQKPHRWLKAISDYRGTTAGGPNFAFDLCTRTVTEEEKRKLDLSCLKVMYNGSEPVRAETLSRFAIAFASCGFKSGMFLPCYGLAEATLFVCGGPSLFVSGGPPEALPARLHLDAAILESGGVVPIEAENKQSRCLVSSGKIGEGVSVAIVDPASMQRAATGRVGEIWVNGCNVAAGYWGQAEETLETFANVLPGSAKTYLRTGDLGFASAGELYITGRLKDLIIVRGRNIYPQDIEAAVERVMPFLGVNSCAAVSLERAGEEQVAIVVEADRAMVRAVRHAGKGKQTPIAESAATASRKIVAELLEITLEVVAFVRPGSLPRTSSGKIRRRPCRDGLTDGSLELLYRSDLDAIQYGTSTEQLCASQAGSEVPTMPERVRSTIMATCPKLRASKISLDAQASLFDVGLDSIDAASLAVALGNEFGCEVDIQFIYDNDSIEHIVTGLERGELLNASEVKAARGLRLSGLEIREVQYPSERADAFRLRYAAYAGKGYIPPTSDEEFSDEYDDQPNCSTFLIQRAESLIGSIRTCVYLGTDGWNLIPALDTFRDDIGEFTVQCPPPWVEANRFVLSPGETAVEIKWALFGAVAEVADKHQCRQILAAVRPEHVRFYESLGFRTVSQERKYHKVAFTAVLLALDWIKHGRAWRDRMSIGVTK